jgi:hypothetical protein
MRVSEFGRWFRFLSVVSLMLCGFSINSWAACTSPPTINTTVQTPVIGPLGTTIYEDVPASATVVAGGTVQLVLNATLPGGCSNLYFQWQYWNFSTSQWINFPLGTAQPFYGATVSNSTSTSTSGSPVESAIFTLAGIPVGFGAAVNPTMDPNGLFLVSATTTDNSISNSTRSNTVTITVESEGWLPDSPGGIGVESPSGPAAPGTNPAYTFGPLPSGSGTYERGTLLPSGHIFDIGYNPGSAASTEEINIDVTPGQGDGLEDLWVQSNVNLDTSESSCNVDNAQRPTTTLLPNGGVLIAGGLITTTDTNAACVWFEGVGGGNAWTPGSGDSISETGNLTTHRDASTATLMGNGLVLIAGGASQGRVLGTGELYNPATGTFAAIHAPMTITRYHHTATLLPNGTVLIVGGNDQTNSNTLATAEIYDPVANKFTATSGGGLNVARAYHAATVLPDGNVLITGGVDEAGQPLQSAEIYDLVDQTFYLVAQPMIQTRSQHTSTLLANGTVLLAGGAITNGWLNESEIFDPTAGGTVSNDDTAGTFTLTTNAAGSVVLNYKRDRHNALLVADGMVVAAGGTTLGSLGVVDPIEPTAEKFGEVNQGTPVIPQAGITFSASPVYIGQTISAYCGPVNANGTSTQNPYLGFNEVSFAWILEGGATLTGNPAVDYPNWPDTAQINFTVAATSGNVTISCLATSIYGIPSITSTFVPESTLRIAGTAPLALSLTSSPLPTYLTPPGTPSPQYTTVPAGSSLTFIAQLSPPSANYTYTWQVMTGGAGPWVTIPGQTASTLYMPSVPVSLNGNVYQVIATGTLPGGAGGTVTSSNTLTLDVVGSPAISIPPTVPIMGPPGNCAFPLTGGVSNPCAVDQSGEAPFLPVVTPSPIGVLPVQISYQWCMGTATPTPFLGVVVLASNLCTPNQVVAGANGTGPIYNFTPPAVPGVSGTYYLVAYETINTVNGAPGFSPFVTETAYEVPGVTITNNTSCPASGANTPATCVTAGNPQTDPTVDAGNNVTLTATFTGTPFPVLNTDPTYDYTWAYMNTIKGWKPFPAGYINGNGYSVTIPSTLVGSDGLQIEVIVTDSSWPGFLSSNTPGSTNTVTSNSVFLQVIPASTVAIAETADDETTDLTPPVGGPEQPGITPIQGHEVVLTATITGTPQEVDCSGANNCQKPTYKWYRVASPSPVAITASGTKTPANNTSNYNTCDSEYTIANTVNTGDTLIISPLCLADQGQSYYAVAGYTENGIYNTSQSNTIAITVNWDQVTSLAAQNYTRFDAMSVMLPAEGGTLGGWDGGYSTGPSTESVFWIAGGQNSTEGVLSTGAGFQSAFDYNTTTDTTPGNFTPTLENFVAGPHLDGTATLFLSGAPGPSTPYTSIPYVAVIGGSDGQDAQTGIEYFIDPLVSGDYVASNLTLQYPTTQQVAALLPTGKILIAGGQNGDYDTFYNAAYLLTPGATPGTGDTIATSDATLSVARAASKSTTLDDGRILITGGVDFTGVDNAVDIYDSSTYDENTYVNYPLSLYNLNDTHLPSINTSGDFFANAICTNLTAPTPCMGSARLYHTQTLLNDGRVLITGGINQNGQVLGSIEIWDPKANPTAYAGYGGGFYAEGATLAHPTYTGPAGANQLLTPRMMASAVLLPTGQVLVFGGEDPYGNVLNSAEIVDPHWTYSARNPAASVATNSMTQPREEITSTLLPSGEVLASGGVFSLTDTGTLGEIYDALQWEGSSATVPSPEVPADLNATSPVFVSTTNDATVTESGNNDITTYDWSAQDVTTDAVLPVTLVGTPAPLSSEASYTLSSSPSTYNVDVLVIDQYGLSYLLNAPVVSYATCPEGEVGPPNGCYTPVTYSCTTPVVGSGAVTVTAPVSGTLEYNETNTVALNLADVAFGTYLGPGTVTYDWEVSGGIVAEATFPETSTNASITPLQANTSYTITVTFQSSECTNTGFATLTIESN